MNQHFRLRLLWPLFAIPAILFATSAGAWQPPDAKACPPQVGATGPADTHLYFVTTRSARCDVRPARFGERRGATRFGRFEPASPPVADRLVPVVRAEADWYADLRSDATRSGGRVLIYVHGYFNSFDDALARMRTLRRQSGFAAPMLLFSWPSEDCFLCYTRDEENALWTQPYFDRLLNVLLQDSAITEIVLVAHSMGNRIVLRGVAEADRSTGALALQKLRTVVLASPDVDRAMVERDYLTVLDRPDRKTVVYASRIDVALRTSWKVHGYPRAGETACTAADLSTDRSRPRCPMALRAGGAVTLVDTSLVRRGNGHGDFTESAAAAADLCRVLNGRSHFPGREPLAGNPNIVLLTDGALSPADCPR